jgi:hypothetical protein
MKWRTFEVQREPGFRLNLVDLILIGFLVAASLAWRSVYPDQHLWLLPLYVGLSFFLFCNVFRIGNRAEPPWYLTFVAIAVWGLTREQFPWAVLLVVCESLKVALILWRIVRGPYVGAFHRTLGRFSGRSA